jgi:hypothetical protein
MTTKFSVPSVEAIQEDSEDESRDESRGKGDDSHDESSYRTRPSTDNMFTFTPTRANMGKERERRRRTHRAAPSDSRNHKKNTSVRRASGLSRDVASDSSRVRHRRSLSNQSYSSSSSDEEQEPIQDHRAVLAAARARLTSPSVISSFTALTTSTNKSSGSSGSNSTVTQSSVSKLNTGKQPEVPEVPMSPAVPDAPNVFAFLEEDQEGEPEEEHDQNDEDEEEEDEEEEEEESDDEDHEQESQWPQYPHPSLPPHLATPAASTSSSSSFHGSDHFSETPADGDTDRSTSPERSVKGHASDHASDHDAEADPEPASPASVKFASQMAAAHQRQSAHSTMSNFGTPNMPRGDKTYPYVPNSTALSPHYQQHVKQRSLPRAEKIPVTGYELLASRLSSHVTSENGEEQIKPIYRKFEALNHRLLLHLQDEISELEEQLHRLDNADTQSRRIGLEGKFVPASRRVAVAAGGDLQWHKTDILGRIGFKLAQYSMFSPSPLVFMANHGVPDQALAAFSKTAGLPPAAPTDVTIYREYLHSAHPIAEPETHFVDQADDLVSVCSSIPPSISPSHAQTSTSQTLTQANYWATRSSGSSIADTDITPAPEPIAKPALTSLAIAIAVAILVPILTFSVIPGFMGRITVTGLVAGGVVGALIQAEHINAGQMLEREGFVCGGIYVGGMVLVAGIMG